MTKSLQKRPSTKPHESKRERPELEIVWVASGKPEDLKAGEEALRDFVRLLAESAVERSEEAAGPQGAAAKLGRDLSQPRDLADRSALRLGGTHGGRARHPGRLGDF